MPTMLDLFCGRLGWSKAFLARGWDCVAIDLVEPPDIPDRVAFVRGDILTIGSIGSGYDFVCASPPCEEFSCFGMKHFRPNPPYPNRGIELFLHTKMLCRKSRAPYVIENVKPAQKFIGRAMNHCGPFFLWGTAVPPIMPQGISKAKWTANSKLGRNAPGNFAPELLLPKPERKARLATIPPELANCVADYAERLLEQREARCQTQS